MAIKEIFIHFQNKTEFEKKKENITNSSIVFILDSKEIYTHGTFYPCVYEGSEELKSALQSILGNYYTKEEVDKKLENFDFDGDFITRIDVVPSADTSLEGTPSAEILEIVNGVAKLTFHQLKGNSGTSAGFGTPTYDNTEADNSGPASVEVTTTSDSSNTAKVFNFKFKNIKGEKGNTPNISIDSEGYLTVDGIRQTAKNLIGPLGTGVSVKASKLECTSIGDAYIDEEGNIMIKTGSGVDDFTNGGQVKGPQGEQGDTWVPSVTEEGVLNWTKNSGTTPANGINLKGPKGDTPNISIGTVTSGTTAAASITGTTPNLTLNLTLPKDADYIIELPSNTTNSSYDPTISNEIYSKVLKGETPQIYLKLDDIYYKVISTELKSGYIVLTCLKALGNGYDAYALMLWSTGKCSLINRAVNTFTGATSSTDGKFGFVPAPSTGDEDKVLKGDGTWDTIDLELTSSNKHPDLPDGMIPDGEAVLIFKNGSKENVTHLISNYGVRISGSNEWLSFDTDYLINIPKEISLSSTNSTFTIIESYIDEVFNAFQRELNIIFTYTSSDKVYDRFRVYGHRLNNNTNIITFTAGSPFTDNILCGEINKSTSSITLRLVPIGGSGGSGGSYSAFTGASSSASGTSGLVPAPSAGDENKVLKGNGSWSTPTFVAGTGENSILRGDINYTSSFPGAIASLSVSLGLNRASGLRSISEGYYTNAGGDYSHAEGRQTNASGNCAHSEGYVTKASGDYSHAEGYLTEATVANSHASGKYNISNDNTLFSIGNGTTNSLRHNAFEVTTEGDIYVPDTSALGLVHEKPMMCLQTAFAQYNKEGNWAVYQNFAGGAGKSSDIRYKTNITEFDDVLDKVNDLKIFNYTWSKEGDPKVDTFGVSAQLLEELGFDRIVQNTEDGTKSVEYDRLGIIALKAIQELTKLVVKQLNEINYLRSKL